MKWNEKSKQIFHNPTAQDIVKRSNYNSRYEGAPANCNDSSQP